MSFPLAKWPAVVALSGGTLLAASSWLGRAPTDNTFVTSLWLLSPLLLSGGIYGLSKQSGNTRLAKGGLTLCWLTCLLVVSGGTVMVGLRHGMGFALYAGGVLAMPVGFLLYSVGLDGEPSARALRLAALLTALVTGPGAVALELGGVYPDLGWTMWGVGTGVGWLLIGSLLLARHREAHLTA